MNKILVLITSLLMIFSCKAQDEVSNISKSCNELKEKNIIHYQMCLEWNLSAGNILEIIQNKHEEFLPNDVDLIHFYGFNPDNIYIKAEIAKNNKIYDITLGTESWFLLTEKGTDKSQLFSCQNPKISQYFIGNFITEATVDQNPELEKRYKRNYQTAINSILQQQPTALEDFKGNYFFSNLTVSISDTVIKINAIHYDLPLFLKEDDSIRVYQGLANEQTMGNFIFTIFIKNNRHYFQSPYFINNKIIEIKKRQI